MGNPISDHPIYALFSVAIAVAGLTWKLSTDRSAARIEQLEANNAELKQRLQSAPSDRPDLRKDLMDRGSNVHIQQLDTESNTVRDLTERIKRLEQENQDLKASQSAVSIGERQPIIPTDADLVQERTRYGLRPLTEFESGARLSDLPTSVFGYAFAGGLANRDPKYIDVYRTPTNDDHGEVHKLPNGSVLFFLWITEDSRLRLARFLSSTEGDLDLVLFTKKWEQASVRVGIPLELVKYGVVTLTGQHGVRMTITLEKKRVP